MNVTKTISYNDDGTFVIIDDRNVEDCKLYKHNELRKEAMKTILEVAPDFKQRNAALGLLSAEETNIIVTHIKNIREQCDDLLNAVDNISWDGNESTRSQVCDMIMNINF